jgi:hypothetical protein
LEGKRKNYMNLIHIIGLSEWRAMRGKPMKEISSMERLPVECLGKIAEFFTGSKGSLYQQREVLT